MSKYISRRQMLMMLAAVAGKLGLSALSGRVPSVGRAEAGPQPRVYLPFVSSGASSSLPISQTPPSVPANSRVVHVHDVGVTSWDYGNDYYGNYVDQYRVDTIVDQGVTALTGAPSPAEAWQALVPGYEPGKAIAIKVNFNNNYETCDSDNLKLDALIHPINAIISGLLAAYPYFQPSDIWVYDATGKAFPEWGPRNVNTRFQAGCLYPGVRYFDYECNEKAGYTSTDPSANVIWHNPSNIPTPPSGIKVTDVLVDATYVINIPIMKRHWAAGLALGFKNHFGSIENCFPLHEWVYASGSHYGGVDYNPVVDVYRNANIAGKTVLVIGDALFGNWENNYGKAKPWVTFGNAAPDSLLFATDPVAIDCVMCDLLNAEWQLDSIADDYLVYANSLGMGTYERGDPWGQGYSQIDYIYLPGSNGEPLVSLDEGNSAGN